MPYDLQTVFGTRHGQLTPEEMRASVLRQAVGGGDNSAAIAAAKDAGDLSKDSFFDDDGPSRETLNMEARNGMVDQRQQGERLMDRAAANSSGIPESGSRMDRGDWRGLLDAQTSGAMQQETLKNNVRGKFTNMLDAPGRPPDQGPANPDPTQDTRNMGGTSDNDLMKMSLYSSILNGGQGSDVGKYLIGRDESRSRQQQAGVQTQMLQQQLMELQRQSAEAEAARRRAAGLPPDPNGAVLPRVDAAGVSSRPEASRALDVAGKEAERIGGKTYLGTNFDEENPLPQDSQLDALIDAAAQEYVKLGVSPDEARAYVLSQLQQKYGQDQGGLSIPYVMQKGQSAVAQHLSGLR